MYRVTARRPNGKTCPFGERNVEEVDVQDNTYIDEDCLGNNKIAIVVIDQSVDKLKVRLFGG